MVLALNYPQRYAIKHHHHHHVVPLARIALTPSRHFSLSFITSGRSSGLHPVSSHSCCMYVRAGCPAFAWPYAGVHRSTSLMSSSLLLQWFQVFLSNMNNFSFFKNNYFYLIIVLCLHTVVKLKESNNNL